MCLPLALFSVVDGHAGFKAAEYVVRNIVEIFWDAVCALQEEEMLEQAKADSDPQKTHTLYDEDSDNKGANIIAKSRGVVVRGCRRPRKQEQEQGGSGQDEMGNFVRRVLKRTIRNLDRAWLKRVHGARPKINDGACVLLCLMADSKLHLAHVGDCRAVLYNASCKFQVLTQDHKPGISKIEDDGLGMLELKFKRARRGGSRVCTAGMRICHQSDWRCKVKARC